MLSLPLSGSSRRHPPASWQPAVHPSSAHTDVFASSTLKIRFAVAGWRHNPSPRRLAPRASWSTHVRYVTEIRLKTRAMFGEVGSGNGTRTPVSWVRPVINLVSTMIWYDVVGLCCCSIISCDTVSNTDCGSDLQMCGRWTISRKTEIASVQDEDAVGIFADWEL